MQHSNLNLKPEDDFLYQDDELDLDIIDMDLNWDDTNIIKKRFGIDSKVMTIDEIAEEQNISREDASALLGQAIRMLKHPSRSIKGYPILLRLENK